MNNLTEKQSLIVNLIESEGLITVTAGILKELTGLNTQIIGGILTGLINKNILTKGEKKGEWYVIEKNGALCHSNSIFGLKQS